MHEFFSPGSWEHRPVVWPRLISSWPTQTCSSSGTGPVRRASQTPAPWCLWGLEEDTLYWHDCIHRHFDRQPASPRPTRSTHSSRRFKELRSWHRLVIAFLGFALLCLDFDKRVFVKSAFTSVKHLLLDLCTLMPYTRRRCLWEIWLIKLAASKKDLKTAVRTSFITWLKIFFSSVKEH